MRIVGLLIGAAFVALIAVSNFVYSGSVEDVVFTVTDKDTKMFGNSERYMVFTTGETFEITDSWIIWRFDSADMYGKLTRGKPYAARVVGWRVPFLSWNRNIIEAHEVQP